MNTDPKTPDRPDLPGLPDLDDTRFAEETDPGHPDTTAPEEETPASDPPAE